jgi:hypothetical protein
MFATFNANSYAQTNPVEWHGFLSEVVAATDKPVNYGPGITIHPDYALESWLGLNLSTKISSKLSAASQFLARGSERTGGVTADWAFLTYYPVENLSFHIGKQIFSAWLISSYADVGHTYPWVRPPLEVYGINPLKSYSGISATYVLNVGSTELQLESNAGSTSKPVSFSGRTAEVSLNDIYGGVLTLVSDAWTIRAGQTRGKFSITNDLINVHNATGIFSSLGIKGEFAKFVVYGEYADVSGTVNAKDREKAMADAATAIGKAAQTHDPADGAAAKVAGAQAEAHTKNFINTSGYYTTLGYTLGDFLPHLTFARTVLPADSLAAGPQSSVTAGVRYDLSPSAAIKFEAMHVAIPEGSAGNLNYDPEFHSPGEFSHKFNIYSFATNLIF